MPRPPLPLKAALGLTALALAGCLSFDGPRIACRDDGDCPAPGLCAANKLCIGYGGTPSDGGSGGGTGGGSGGSTGGGSGGSTGGGSAGGSAGGTGGGTAGAGGGTGGGGASGGGSSGGGGGSSLRYCERLSPPRVFCLDFDAPNALSAFDGGVSVMGASQAVDGGVWHLNLPATSNSNAGVEAVVYFPGRTELVRVIELDVRVEVASTKHVAVAALLEPPGYTDLFIDDRVRLCNADRFLDGGDCFFSSAALPVGEWCRVTTVLDFDAGTASVRVVTVDGGTPLPACSVDGTLSTPAPPLSPRLQFGAMFPDTPRGATVLRLDNLTFDLR